MQAQRGSIGSLSETLNFDHGASSSNAAIDQQSCWNMSRNTAPNYLPDYFLPSNELHLSSVNRDQHNLSRWSIGEASSSAVQSQVIQDVQKAEVGWSSVSPCAGASSRLEEERYGSTYNFSVDNSDMNPLFTGGANSEAVSQNINLNAGFLSAGLENGLNTVPSGVDPVLLPSRNGGFLVEGNEGRPSTSLEGRRASCKRKALAEHAAESSINGSSSHSRHIGSSTIPPYSATYDISGSLSLSTSSEQLNSSVGLGRREISDEFPELNTAEVAESSHRNFRLRINSSNEQGSFPHTLVTGGSAARPSGFSSSQLPSRLLPVDHPLENLRSPVAVENVSLQPQLAVTHAPSLPQTRQSIRMNGGSAFRNGSSSSSIRSRRLAHREEVGSSGVARNISEHPMFVPSTHLRSLAQHPSNRSLAGGNIMIPGDVGSTSRAATTSLGNPSSSPWIAQENPVRYPRRLSEYVRRQLLSSSAFESAGQTSNFSLMHPGPTPSQDMVLPSGPASQGHNPLHLRSSPWMERQGDGGLVFPHPFRTLAAGGDGTGSSRLVSELRNVLGLMRRGESLRFEDVMLLDQSWFFGFADMHDRHRDMRLDVDNMSYEELLALEERIGNVSTGLSEDTIDAHLKRRKFAVGSQEEAEPCSICQEEYNAGEDLGTLECGHDFHAECIKQWLTLKNLCPICKTTAFST